MNRKVQMTTYKTYQEAKISNPELEVYRLTDKFGFVSGEDFGNSVRLVHQRSDTEKCNPAEHCMTVEKFLADGHKGENGDWFLIGNGIAKRLGINGVYSFNKPSPKDCNVFILRAAALEDKKPRTKVEYVKVSAPCDFFDLKYEFRGEELSFINEDGDYEVATTLVELVTGFDNVNLYRRIETPMTEREVLLESLKSVWIIDGVDGQEQLEKIVDSGLFKLVN